MTKTELYNELLALTRDVGCLSYNHGEKIGRDTATIYHDQDENPKVPEYHKLRAFVMEHRTSSPDGDSQHFFIEDIELFFDDDNELHIY